MAILTKEKQTKAPDLDALAASIDDKQREVAGIERDIRNAQTRLQSLPGLIAESSDPQQVETLWAERERLSREAEILPARLRKASVELRALVMQYCPLVADQANAYAEAVHAEHREFEQKIAQLKEKSLGILARSGEFTAVASNARNLVGALKDARLEDIPQIVAKGLRFRHAKTN